MKETKTSRVYVELNNDTVMKIDLYKREHNESELVEAFLQDYLSENEYYEDRYCTDAYKLVDMLKQEMCGKFLIELGVVAFKELKEHDNAFGTSWVCNTLKELEENGTIDMQG